MIVYTKLWSLLSEKNISQYRLIRCYHVSPGQLSRLRHNHPVYTSTLDYFCCILECRLEDIAEYIPDTVKPGMSPAGNSESIGNSTDIMQGNISDEGIFGNDRQDAVPDRGAFGIGRRDAVPDRGAFGIGRRDAVPDRGAFGNSRDGNNRGPM